jgi:hypothetical protein
VWSGARGDEEIVAGSDEPELRRRQREGFAVLLRQGRPSGTTPSAGSPPPGRPTTTAAGAPAPTTVRCCRGLRRLRGTRGAPRRERWRSAARSSRTTETKRVDAVLVYGQQRCLSLRDVGTEMTPGGSKETSRANTPRATAPTGRDGTSARGGQAEPARRAGRGRTSAGERGTCRPPSSLPSSR